MKSYEFLQIYAKILATYDKVVTKTCQKYGLNHTCFDILIFLVNNPQYDTARSIEEKRGIKKAMASVAIKKLYQSGYLVRRADESDRRIQHIELTEKSKEITDIGQNMQNLFHKRLISGLTQEEQTYYEEISKKIIHSLHDMEEIEEMEETYL